MAGKSGRTGAKDDAARKPRAIELAPWPKEGQPAETIRCPTQGDNIGDGVADERSGEDTSEGRRRRRWTKRRGRAKAERMRRTKSWMTM